jgi:hypothetical protein
VFRLLVALTCVVATDTALAHHGISNFDLNKDISITGTLTGIDLVNPHSWLHITVKEGGKVSEWRCEMRAATVLKRSGWSTDMFRIGTQVTVTGSPDRSKPRVCYLGTIVFADGSKMDRYGQFQKPATVNAARAFRTATGEPNIAGDWAAEQRVMTDPRGIEGAFLPISEAAKLKPGEVPQGTQAFPGARGTPESLAPDPVRAAWTRPPPVNFTEAGKRASQAFDATTTDNPRLKCEPTNILFDWTFDTLINRIVQTKESIVLKYGFMDMERTIHLNVAEHPAKITPSRAGHSIGRWENDVLVVDTIGFAPGVLSADRNTLHSAQLHIVERFSLDPKTQALTRTYVAEDPLYFTGQYRGSDVVYPADLPYEPYRCDDRSGARTKTR